MFPPTTISLFLKIGIILSLFLFFFPDGAVNKRGAAGWPPRSPPAPWGACRALTSTPPGELPPDRRPGLEKLPGEGSGEALGSAPPQDPGSTRREDPPTRVSGTVLSDALPVSSCLRVTSKFQTLLQEVFDLGLTGTFKYVNIYI